MADKLQGPSNQVEKTEVSEVSIENIEKFPQLHLLRVESPM